MDDLHDITRLQYDFLARFLALHTGQVLLLGDDDQATFGWRGLQREVFANLVALFSDFVAASLRTNYRSAQPVLDAARLLIGHNPNRLESKFGISKLLQAHWPLEHFQPAYELVRRLFVAVDLPGRSGTCL